MSVTKASQLPKDAVVLTEVEATTYIWEVVNDWQSFSEAWALRYAPAMLGAINSVSGVLINNYYRRRFKLRNFGYFSSVIPISIMPGILTALFHRHMISTDMLLMKRDACPICYETRSGLIQVALGTLYPMFLGPLAALMYLTAISTLALIYSVNIPNKYANRYVTYRIPDLQEGPRVIFKFLKGHTKPFTGTLGYLVAIQLAASSILTYFEMRNNFAIRQKINELETKFSEES